jgi:hypothetical protein
MSAIITAGLPPEESAWAEYGKESLSIAGTVLPPLKSAKEISS